MDFLGPTFIVFAILLVVTIAALSFEPVNPLDAWLKRAMRSRLEPIKKVARSIRSHERLILNWFAAKKEFSSGIVEGLNYRIKLTIRKAYGFRTLEAAEIALYHALGHLPEPKLTHELC